MNYTYRAGNYSNAPEFIHFIGYVNCPELLEKAIASTIPVAREGMGVIIDNRSDRSLPAPHMLMEGKEAEQYFSVLEPDVPLTFAQTMNFLIKISAAANSKFFTWIHADGEVIGNSLELVLHARQQIADGTKWGTIFTLYDIYAAFSTEACLATGDWDWLRFPFYFCDNDYYHRLRTADYKIINIGGQGIIHHNEASNTIKNDPLRLMLNHHLFPVWEKLFKDKYAEDTVLSWEGE